MSNRKGFRPIGPTPPRFAALAAGVAAGAVLAAAVAAGSVVDVLVSLIVAGVLVGLALVIDAAVDASIGRQVDEALTVRATAPRTAPGRPAEPGQLTPCAVCRAEPAVAGDELGWLCLGVFGRPPVDLRAAGAELSELAAADAIAGRRLRQSAGPACPESCCRAAARA